MPRPPPEKIYVQYRAKSVVISRNNNIKALITPLLYITEILLLKDRIKTLTPKLSFINHSLRSTV